MIRHRRRRLLRIPPKEIKVHLKSAFVFLCVLEVRLFSMQTAPEAERLRLVNADICNGDKDVVRICTGNVQFRQGLAVMLCDKATQFVQEGKVIFEDHVLIIKKGKELRADRITYFDQSQIAFAEHNVQFKDSTKTLSADKIRYFDLEDKAIAEGAVVITEVKERFKLEGQKAEYLRKTGYAKVIGQPVLTKLDSLGQAEIVIHGKTMEMFSDGDSLKVLDDVVVTRGEVVAHCGTLMFLQSDDKIKLSDKPNAEQKDTFISGNSLELLLKKNDLKAIHVIKEAIAVSKNDSTPGLRIPYDILTGEDILVNIKDDQIDSVTVTGKATSYYHVIEEGKEKGLNKVLGDRLMMSLKGGQLKKVNVFSKPSISAGVFYPSTSQTAVVKEMNDILIKYNIQLASDLSTAATEAEPDGKAKKE
jgi:lipopolysaccharide export system protein LptA